jgi:nucleotide-binding universal stress UspA family protein
MNILVLSDFSANAKNAMYFALDLALESEATVKILNCVSVPHSKSNVVVSIMDILKEDSEKGLNELKEEIAAKKAYNKLTIEMLSSVGELSSTVQEISSKWEVDFVVMGTKGMTALEEIFIGSNTTKVISEISLPILAIPVEAEYSSINQITLAADLIPLKSKAQLASLKMIANKFVDTVQLMHVYSSSDHVLSEDQTNELSSIKEYLSPLKVNEHFISHNKSSDELASFAAVKNNDLLAMVSRKQGFFKRLFSSSNTETVALKTAIPLLVIPEIN